MKKLSSILAATFLLASFAGGQERGVKTGYPQPARSVEELYESAIAHWEFNDNLNLGYEGGDWSPPAASFPTTAYAGGSTAGLFGQFDWGVCGWMKVTAAEAAANAYFFSGGSNPYGMSLRIDDTASLVYARVYDSTPAALNDTAAINVTPDTNLFVCSWFDSTGASTGTLYAAVNDGTPESAAQVATVGTAGGGPFIGALGGGVSDRIDGGHFGPWMMWDAIPTAEQMTMLYNGGKGKRCSDLSATELANMTSCWQMDEDPNLGVYEDSIGSMDLTPTNSPVQTAGIVRVGSGDPTLDLIPTNAPTATGGATGEAAYFTRANQEEANGTDVWDSGDGISWGFAGWLRIEDVTDRYLQFFGKATDAVNAEGEYQGFFDAQAGLELVNCRLYDSVGLKNNLFNTGGTSTGDRIFVTCRYDATANEIEAGLNGAWTGSPTSTDSDGADTTHVFSAPTCIASFCPGQIQGPSFFYYSTSGGTVLTDAITSSLYNGGKGKTCAALTAAERVNLAECWDMDDDPATTWYVGTNDAYVTSTYSGSWYSWAETTDSFGPSDDATLISTNTSQTYQMFGLTDATVTATGANQYSKIDYAAYCYPDTTRIIWYHLGVVEAQTTGVACDGSGDELKLEKTGTTVKGYLNDVLKVTFAAPATGTYKVGFTSATQGETSSPLTINGAEPAWTNLLGMAVGHALRGINTPTQSEALVEQPESGMSLADANGNVYVISPANNDIYADDMTICLWGLTKNNGSNFDLVHRYTSNQGYFIRLNAGTLSPGFYNYDGTSASAASAGNMTLNEWFFFCGVQNNGDLRAYLDGVVGTPYVRDLVNPAVRSFYIGGPSGTGTGQNTIIDSVWIWNFPLAAGEIETLYADGEGVYY